MAQGPIRLRVTATAEKHLRQGHPWLYASSIREQNRTGEAGDLAVVYDRNNRFLVIGLWDPQSPLRLRVLHRGHPLALTEDWWQEHLDRAWTKRKGLISADTTGLRLIHGENDDWPGLVLDQYASTLVVKLYTAAWLPRLPELTRMISERFTPERVVLRLSRNIQATAQDQFGLEDGTLLQGTPLTGPVHFQESGIHFEAEVSRGQKTGFFLDQRDNRRHVESLGQGRDVLNAFSFSGGFSLYAARGGARSVTDLDISHHALQSARRNWDLNAEDPKICRCQHQLIQADVFEWLHRAPAHRYDLIILDPPSLARRESERTGAIRAYGQLAALARRHLRPAGILVASSCSSHVSRDEFFTAVQSAWSVQGVSYEVLKTAGHPLDHAPSFPEANYLKCIYLKLG